MAFYKPPSTVTTPSSPTPSGEQRVSLLRSFPIPNPGSWLQPGATPPSPAPAPTPTPGPPPGVTEGGPGMANQPVPDPTQTGNPTDGSQGNPPATGNTAPGQLPSNPVSTPVTTPNEQVGNPSGSVAGLSFAQVENYWIQAGGSPQAAAMAAAVADAESGLNAAAQRTNPDGTLGLGLWLIPQNGTPPGSTDPLANARAAVQLSQNGTDWTQWCSTWSDNNCGQNNGTYLGQGANALMSLAGQKPGASYNVFGATPSSTGVGASTATSGLGSSSTTTSGKPSLLIFAIIIVITVVIIVVARRKSQRESVVSTEVTPEGGEE